MRLFTRESFLNECADERESAQEVKLQLESDVQAHQV